MNNWIRITPDTLPNINVLVGLIDINSVQNDPAGDYPVSRIGHLSCFGTSYWSCYGERAISLDGFTHWCELPALPVEFLSQFDT